MKKLSKYFAIVLAASCSTAALAANAARPNVVIIVADDLGFSDLGAFGGEIRTPNLDALARSGLRLTNFHAAPTCSPTRSMLLSGTDNHTAGVGAMAEMRTMDNAPLGPVKWGYEGVITNRVATLAERLHNGGYYTILSGKWHLGLAPDQNPASRGFDSSFALLQGADNHFGGGFGPATNPNLRETFTQDGQIVRIPNDFYSSDYFTSKIIAALDERPKDRPFFAYLAFTAPHSPLQAPPEDIARYRGQYDKGWAALRKQRLARMKQLGIIPRDIIPANIDGYEQAWNKLTSAQKRIESRKMEIYAGMVDRLDQNVGRLIKRLKQSGVYDNTIFIFTSDNGPAGEGAETYGRLPGMAAYLAKRDNSLEAMGTKASFIFYGPDWAQAASAPFRLYKGVITEGGTRVAAFITYKRAQRQHAIGDAFADVMDVTPTVLEATSLAATPVVNGREVAPIRGRSMLRYLRAASERVHRDDETLSFELHGHRAVRQGKWKLLLLPPPFGDKSWALFDLETDPAEQHDLSSRFPDRKQALIKAWDAFARDTRIDQ